MNIDSLVQRMLMLLLIIAVGYTARKTKLFNEQGIEAISKLTVDVCIGALILGSVMNIECRLSRAEILILIAASFGAHLIMYAISLLVPILLRVPKEKRGIYHCMGTFGNCGFMGYPVVASLMGAEYVIYAAIFTIPFNLMCFSLGAYMVSGKEKRLKLNLKSFVNTPLIASLLALIIIMLNIKVPEVIAQTARTIGDITVPASMLVIGGTLAGSRLSKVFSDFRIYVFMVFRLLIMPIAVYYILGLIIENDIILAICTVLSAMPVATASTMMAYSYGGDAELASKGVFMTTILSAVTIPFVVSLLLL